MVPAQEFKVVLGTATYLGHGDLREGSGKQNHYLKMGSMNAERQVSELKKMTNFGIIFFMHFKSNILMQRSSVFFVS